MCRFDENNIIFDVHEHVFCVGWKQLVYSSLCNCTYCLLAQKFLGETFSQYIMNCTHAALAVKKQNSTNSVYKSLSSTSTMKKLFVIITFVLLLWGGLVFAQSESTGIECSPEQLRSGQCRFNIYQTLGIRQDANQDTSVGLFLQDIVLSMTFFIGTLVTIVIIIAWLMYIWSAFSGNTWLQDRAKKWLIGAFIGLLLVMGSYVIIRLVQFIVRGG